LIKNTDSEAINVAALSIMNHQMWGNWSFEVAMNYQTHPSLNTVVSPAKIVKAL
jgi:hypothetical protein